MTYPVTYPKMAFINSAAYSKIAFINDSIVLQWKNCSLKVLQEKMFMSVIFISIAYCICT